VKVDGQTRFVALLYAWLPAYTAVVVYPVDVIVTLAGRIPTAINQFAKLVAYMEAVPHLESVIVHLDGKEIYVTNPYVRHLV